MKSERIDDELLVAEQNVSLIALAGLRCRRERFRRQLRPRNHLLATLVADDPALDDLRRVDAGFLEELLEVPVELAVGSFGCALRVEVLALDDRCELVVEVDADAATQRLAVVRHAELLDTVELDAGARHRRW